MKIYRISHGKLFKLISCFLIAYGENKKIKIGVRVKISKSNFRIANISNLKINERSNVEQPNLRVTTIENENY